MVRKCCQVGRCFVQERGNVEMSLVYKSILHRGIVLKTRRSLLQSMTVGRALNVWNTTSAALLTFVTGIFPSPGFKFL